VSSWLPDAVYTPHLGAAIFGLTAGGWFTYFRLKDRTRRPFWLVLAALVGGNIASLVALLVYEALEVSGLGIEWSTLQAGGPPAVLSALGIGLVEELCKLLPVAALALFTRRIEKPRDGLLLAACAGVGFSAAENMVLTLAGVPLMVEGLARAAAAPVTHALFAAPWGLGLGAMLKRRRLSPFLIGLATSVMSHALYNFLLARPSVPRAAAAGVILVLWAWVLLWTTPRLSLVRAYALLRRVLWLGQRPDSSSPAASEAAFAPAAAVEGPSRAA
jgi:RsiW-degrading membrane proteinase PrsW (M82 family)